MTTRINIENHNSLLQYLRDIGLILPQEHVIPIDLTGGVSNHTVLLQREGGQPDLVIKQALPKLRVVEDWFSDPVRIHREALGVHWLNQLVGDDRIPAFILEDEDNCVLVMTAVPQPHENWKEQLLKGNIVVNHVEQFGNLLGTIHLRAYEQKDTLSVVFEDQSFFDSLRIEPYYRRIADKHPSIAKFVDELVSNTKYHIHTLVHGDYSPKNILVYNDRLILLDHEVIHFGDPAFDIGFSMTHLLSKANHVLDKRMEFANAALLYWQTYKSVVHGLTWADQIESRAVHHTLACLLARVDGRSPLAYLTEDERQKQRQIVLSLMSFPPDSFEDLVSMFINGL